MTCMHLNHISPFDHHPLRLGLLSDRPCRASTTIRPAPAIVTSGSTPAILILACDSLAPSLVIATRSLPRGKLAFGGTPQAGSRPPVSSNGLLSRRDDGLWYCLAQGKSRRDSRLALGERVGLGRDGLSLSPGDQQVEQDRVSAVLTDHDELAWPSLGELPGRCESDWSDYNRDGLAGAGGLRQGVLSDEGEGYRVRVGDGGPTPP